MNTRTEESARTQEALLAPDRIRSILDDLPALVAVMTAGGELQFVNRQVLEYFGATFEELRQWESGSAIHSGDRANVIAAWSQSLDTGQPYDVEARQRRADGIYRWFHIRGFPVREAQGGIVLWHVLQTDVDDRKRAESLLAGEKRLLEMVAGNHSMPQILEEICCIVESTAAGCYCSVVLVDSSGTHLQHGAAPSLPASFIDSIIGRPVNADSGPCALAVYSNQQVISPDLTTETRWADCQWCSMALGHGLRACWSTPISFATGKASGAFAIYYDTPATPTAQQLDLIEHVKHIAGMAIERTQSVAALKRNQALLASEKRLLEMVATGECLAGTLSRLCLLGEELSTHCACCSILLLDQAGQRLWHAASPNVPDAFTQAIDGFAIGPEVSSCGTAAWYAKQVIASDIATDSRWVAFRELALANDLRACWSTPILSQQGRVLGTFAMFSSTARSPTADDQQLIAQVTHLASIAIERSRAEEALKRSEEFLAQAQQVSLTGGFYWWPASGKLAWSEQVYRIFELDPSVPVRPELLWTRIHPEDQPAFRAMLERQLREADDFEHHHRLLMPDASVKYLHVVAKATQDLEGQLQYIAAVQDVTGRHLADEALGKVRSELAHVARVTSLGALTASIAHEVNQPLSGIITNANTCVRMLAADPPNIDGARETARRTIRDGNRASDVIKRLRALFAKEDVAAEPVDLNEATREVIVLSSSELQRHRMIVQLELAENLPSVTGDRVQLQQVILNLILNASEAMSGVLDRPRQLVIRTKREGGGRVLLSVQDAGVGFEPEGVEKMFHAFYTSKSNGMGMGLSISRSIIESHHGRLYAHENEGPGATFSFSIPCVAQSATGEDATLNGVALR